MFGDATFADLTFADFFRVPVHVVTIKPRKGRTRVIAIVETQTGIKGVAQYMSRTKLGWEADNQLETKGPAMSNYKLRTYILPVD